MASNWRQQLQLLDGFLLLPCGAGAKGKAPIDPDTSLPLNNWQNASYTPEQINQMPAHVICVGTRTGPAAGNLLFIDIDGESALKYCINAGCLLEDSGWRITRDTDPTRLKLAFQIKDDALSEQLAACGKLVCSTSVDPKEQVELFYGTGQCIVLGQHQESGGFYSWIDSPKNLSEPSAEWTALIHNLLNIHQKNHLKKASSDNWQDCIPCPICGRTEPDCRILVDGTFIQCHKGSRWHPPFLSRGQIITVDDVNWAFVGDSENAIGPCANFKIDEEKNKQLDNLESSFIEGLDIRPARGRGAGVGKVNWRIQGFAAVGIVLLAAESGTGKTTLLYSAAEAIQQGKDFLNAIPVKQASVLVLQGDEPENVALRKINRMDLEGNFDIAYGACMLSIEKLFELIKSRKWSVIIVDSLTTVVASTDCTTMDLAMASKLYKLNNLASDFNVLLLMTAHLNKPAKDGSGARVKRSAITWADISGVSTISAAVNDAWGLTNNKDYFSLHALGKRHIEAGVEWRLNRYAEDFSWQLKEVTNYLMPRQEDDIKSKILSFLKEDTNLFKTVAEISTALHLKNVEHARRCLCDLNDSHFISRRKRSNSVGRPSFEYGVQE